MTTGNEIYYMSMREANIARQKEWKGNELMTEEFRLIEALGEAGELAEAAFTETVEQITRMVVLLKTMGKVANQHKKLFRDRHGIPARSSGSREALLEELADARVTLDLLAMSYGEDLDEVTEKKFNRDSEKHGFRTRLDLSGNPREEAFYYRICHCELSGDIYLLKNGEDKCELCNFPEGTARFTPGNVREAFKFLNDRVSEMRKVELDRVHEYVTGTPSSPSRFSEPPPVKIRGEDMSLEEIKKAITAALQAQKEAGDCPACGGSGLRRPTLWERTEGATGTGVCPACGGSGLAAPGVTGA